VGCSVDLDEEMDGVSLARERRHHAKPHPRLLVLAI
jgi:hypothetical protein